MDFTNTQALGLAAGIILVGMWLVWKLVIKPTIKMLMLGAVVVAGVGVYFFLL